MSLLSGEMLSLLFILFVCGCVVFFPIFLKLYQRYTEIIMYLIVGVCTTVISLIIYYGLSMTILDPSNALELQIANVISWVISVLFAYITNRKYVFHSKSHQKGKEFVSFVSSRIVTLLLDMFIMYVGVTLLSLNDKIFKVLSQVIVIVANYVFSKLFVFKTKSN